MFQLSRRRLLCATPAVVAPQALGLLAELTLTPAQTEGPFYPDILPLDQDNDLVRIAEASEMAAGEIAYIGGGIYDQEGHPLPSALMEIWQCDAKGVYHHSGDRRQESRDTAFQGYGSYRTGEDGTYHFRTIRPVPYPGRVPHIHVKVTLPNGASLTTQFYAEGDPGLEEDFVMRRTPAELRPLITAPFLPADEVEPGALAAHYDVFLGVTPGDQG